MNGSLLQKGNYSVPYVIVNRDGTTSLPTRALRSSDLTVSYATEPYVILVLNNMHSPFTDLDNVIGYS